MKMKLMILVVITFLISNAKGNIVSSFYDNFEIQIVNLPNVILTGLFGFAFSLMKERSGSLVFPIIGHGIIDFFRFQIQLTFLFY